MNSDLEIIKQIEKTIGKKLKEIPLDKIGSIKNSYTLDNNLHVIGLSLYETKIDSISFITALKNLTLLSIENNQITDISPIKELKALDLLDISSNHITDISPLKELKTLDSLAISNNQITDISPLKDLKSLDSLNIRYNQITDITPLKDLKSLDSLNIRYNQITDLSPLKELKNLGALNIGYNQITDIAPLKDLKSLKSLNMRHNQITDISPLKELENLRRLDLSDNQISQLPTDIADWPKQMEIKWKYDSGGGIILESNPLESPPVEIVKKGREAIAAYFKAMEGEKKALNEVKVLLVGDGGAGKTSLVKRLMGKGFSSRESQTQGINIKHWPVEAEGKDIKVRTWDFGGQEIMHATHQFFLSRRSLYILVVDCRKDEKVEYWLKHIQSFGGDSPVVIVINKIDENPSFDVNRVFLQDKYKNIRGFFRISCATDNGITEFSQHLIKELAQVDLIHTPWPKTWFNMKERLENMKDHFISYQQFLSCCKEEKIFEKTAQETLVDFLNDLGIILHFKEFKLNQTHVLEPHWVTNAVYKIINSPHLAESKGLLKLELLGTILKKEKPEDFHYPPEKHKFIIDLMQKFQLCYEIDYSTILIPDLLAIGQPPFEFEYENSLRFQIEYDFLPRSIMPRFIVKMHRDIDNELRWRTGVVLKDQKLSSSAVITADTEAKTIFIYVQGSQRRDYFAIILKHLGDIHHSFEKLQAIEKVPMPGEPHVTTSYSHLLTLESMKITDFVPDGSKKKYNVNELLGTLYNYHQSNEEILQILRKLQEKSDTEESLLQKATDTFTFNPSFMGLTVDTKKLTLLIKTLFSKKNKPPK